MVSAAVALDTVYDNGRSLCGIIIVLVLIAADEVFDCLGHCFLKCLNNELGSNMFWVKYMFSEQQFHLYEQNVHVALECKRM